MMSSNDSCFIHQKRMIVVLKGAQVKIVKYNFFPFFLFLDGISILIIVDYKLYLLFSNKYIL